MSDFPRDAQQPSESDEAQVLSVGDTLRRLRETRGLLLPEVSARIKYSAVQLGFLETGNWERLPNGVPLRGLVRNYARFLDADVDAVLRLLDQEIGPTRPYNAVPTASARRQVQPQPADVPTRGEPAHRTWAWLLLILVLFGVVGVYAINRGWVPEEWLIFDWLKALRP